MKTLFLSLLALGIGAVASMATAPSSSHAQESVVEPDYDYEVTVPTNQYSGEDSAECENIGGSPTQLCTFEASFDNQSEDLEIQLRKIGDNGVVEDVIEVFDPVEDGDTIFHEWHDSEDFAFEVFDATNNEVISKHYVTELPHEDWFDVCRDHHEIDDSDGGSDCYENGMAVAPGEVPYTNEASQASDNMWNPLEWERGQTEKDYMIVHYQATSENEDGFTPFRYLRISSDGDTAIRVETSELLAFQNGGDGTDESTNALNEVWERNFIIVGFGDDAPPFVDATLYDDVSWSGPQSPAATDIEHGTYQTAFTTGGSSCCAPDESEGSAGEGVILYTGETPEVSIDAIRDKITEGNATAVDVIRRTEETHTDPFYECQELGEAGAGDKYCSEIDPWDGVEDTFHTDNLSENDDAIVMILHPDEWPAYNLDGDTYSIRVEDSFEVSEVPGVDATLNDLLEQLGMDNAFGQLLFSTIILTFFAFFLLQMGATTPIIVMGVLGMMAALSVLGIMPIWVLLLMGIFGIIGVTGKLGILGGGNGEE